MSITLNPPIAQTSTWSAQFIAHDTPVSLVAGQSATVNLRLKNIGLTKWQQRGKNPVHVGYKWFTQAGEPVHDAEDRRTGLPSDLYPRQEASFGATLVAPRTHGVYNLQWDLIAEGVTWFNPTDNPTLVVPVTVTEAPTDITRWRVESNVNIANVARALDGNPMTFWDSGVAQTRGHWFRLNLASPRLVDGIQFLSPGKDFPASYALYISADGRNWVAVAHVEAGNAYDVMTIFAPQSMQYAQINLLGASEASWKISEILVHSSPAWSASASQNTQTASLAIDNRNDTAWSSGSLQTKEMWYSLDLGHPEIISGLTVDSPADALAASYRIAVWNASANRWQVVGEKLNNAAPIDLSFDEIQTQFISIQLLQASERIWTIQHIDVHREMERWLGPNT